MIILVYIEVTRANIGLVPDDYVRKQTLVNSERYTMEKLKSLEGKFWVAESKVVQREYELLSDQRYCFKAC